MTKQFHYFVAGFWLLLALSSTVQAAQPQTANARPNVLFIAIDDLNDWIGCFGGHPQVKTPNLDRFHAQGGMVFHKAHAPATVCGPSRSALLTGVHAYKTGVYGNKTNLKDAPKAKDLLTLPQYFSKHGYHTLSMGKIFHKHTLNGNKFGDQGQWAFQEWRRSPSGIGPEGKKRPIQKMPNLPGMKVSSHTVAFDWAPTKVNDETKMKDYGTAKWAAKQLAERDFDKPFFMAIGISKPHLPWFVPQKYFDMYPLADIQLPATIENDLSDIVKANGKPAVKPHDTWLRVEKYGKHKEAVRAYLATVSFADDCLGVLLDGLNKSKYAENTIVMLWGDHGWHLGEKQKYGKTQLWQESCRVPLMVKVPGVTQANQRCDGVVNLIDMYPTLIDLCGLPENAKNDGRSFARLIANPEMNWRAPTLTVGGYKSHRIFDGRYSYIINKRNGAEELYDHEKDPMEWKNLASNPEFAEIKTRLKQYVPAHDEPISPES